MIEQSALASSSNSKALTSAGSLMRAQEELRIRNQHLTSLLVDAHAENSRQARELVVLKHALAAAVEERKEMEKADAPDISPPESSKKVDSEPQDATIPHLFSLLESRDTTIMTMSNTIRTLREEVTALRERERLLESEAKSLRMEVDALRGVRLPAFAEVAKGMSNRGEAPKGMKGLGGMVGEEYQYHTLEEASMDNHSEPVHPDTDDESKKSSTNVSKCNLYEAQNPGSRIAVSYTDAAKSFVVTEPTKKFVVTQAFEDIRGDVDGREPIRWLNVDRSPPKIEKVKSSKKSSHSFRPQSLVTSRYLTNNSPTTSDLPHRASQPVSVTHHLVTPRESIGVVTPTLSSASTESRVRSLERERDGLEEELLQRYTELRRVEAWYQDELERRDRELEFARIGAVMEDVVSPVTRARQNEDAGDCHRKVSLVATRP
ncbi:hypothetical protein HDU67_010408 [Dinochytrium kinnereticum]|nr:hypothetical protein HDU67_010408 [Dinochytrium kinnereticum]